MTPDWLELDRKTVWHPYTQALTAPAPLAVTRAEGAWLHTAGGRRVLDGTSSWWVNLHGHSHPRLVEAIRRQAARLQQVIFAGCAHEPAARLAARLVDLSPAGLERVFYSDDGSTAVEVALKLAAQYWQLRGEPGRTLFVSLEHAYHGDTFGAMAAGGITLFRETFEPLLFETRQAPAPYSWAFDRSRDPEACLAHSRRELERVLEREGSRVAAVIVEPMLQGAGGMIVWPADYLRFVREACDRHRVLLIADEVFTGFGRTGRLFASEHGPISPDLLCLSKALTGGFLPLAATLASREIWEAFLSEDRRKTFFHGHSFTANPIACAVALESLAVLEEERTLERIARLEALHEGRLEGLRDHPLVGETRSIGPVAVLELDPPAAGAAAGTAGYLHALGPRLQAALLERDLLVRPLGNVLYFLPPAAIRDEEAHRAFDAIAEALDEVAGDPAS